MLGVSVGEGADLYLLCRLSDCELLPSFDVRQARDVIAHRVTTGAADGNGVPHQKGAGCVCGVEDGRFVFLDARTVGVPADISALLEDPDVAVGVEDLAAGRGTEVAFLEGGCDGDERRSFPKAGLHGDLVDDGCGIELRLAEVTLGGRDSRPGSFAVDGLGVSGWLAGGTADDHQPDDADKEANNCGDGYPLEPDHADRDAGGKPPGVSARAHEIACTRRKTATRTTSMAMTPKRASRSLSGSVRRCDTHSLRAAMSASRRSLRVTFAPGVRVERRRGAAHCLHEVTSGVWIGASSSSIVPPLA